MQLATQDFDFTPSIYYRWEQPHPDSVPEFKQDSCRHIIVGYRLKDVPEFNEIQDDFADENYAEALLRQKMLIDTVSNVFFNSSSNLTGYLELRLANNINNKTVSCYLLLRIILTSPKGYQSPVRLLGEFKKLIPDEYGLEPLTQPEITIILQLREDQSLVEMRKKTSYLPVGSPFLENSYGIAPRNVGEWDAKTKYHVPCVSYIEPKTYNLSNLYKTLQNTAEPVQIRISVGAANTFSFERHLGLQYHTMLNATYGAIDSSVTANITALSKYISATRLFSLKMQVAANNETTAMSIANTFAGQLSYGEVKKQTDLHYFSLKKIDIETKRLDWEKCNHCFYFSEKETSEFSDPDEAVSAFITRMPYISDNSEVMAVFRLPVANAAGLPGLVTKPIKPFYQPSQKEKEKGDVINLGKVITSANAAVDMPYSLPLSDLTKHGLIVGATGSGKTNTTLNFLKELIKNDIPFLLVEPVKAEYYHQLLPLFEQRGKKLHRFKLENPVLPDGRLNSEFLRFNPFVAQKNITMFQHLSYIKSCFMAAFPMFGIMPLILEDCLYEYFKSPLTKYSANNPSVKGFKEKDFFNAGKTISYWLPRRIPSGEEIMVNNDHRTLPGFSEYVTKYLKDNDKLFDSKMKGELEGSLNRRFMKLTKGLLGEVFCPNNWREGPNKWSVIPDNMETILNEPCIIELEALPENDDKALIMAFLLSFLFENRQTRKSHSPENQLHVAIIEEAHRLLSSSSMKSTGGGEGASLSQDSGSKTISLFIDMLAEIRAKNQAIFIVEQSPTKLIADAIKNTNLKIMHRLTNKSDRNYLGEAMNMDEQQSRYATTLQQGEALVFEEQLDKPILVKMNSFKES